MRVHRLLNPLNVHDFHDLGAAQTHLTLRFALTQREVVAFDRTTVKFLGCQGFIHAVKHVLFEGPRLQVIFASALVHTWELIW